MAEYVVAVDAMGGDNALGRCRRARLMAVQEMKDVRILLIGTPETVEKGDFWRGAHRIRPATEIIDPHEAPLLAVRRKLFVPQWSSARWPSRRAGRGRWFSASSTGAVLACGILRIGRIQGIDRPALASRCFPA